MQDDQLKLMIALSDRRQMFSRMSKQCPECNTNQIQLVDWFGTGRFRCRRCKCEFEVYKMNFANAFSELIYHTNRGVSCFMRRYDWNLNTRVRIQVPDEHSKMTHPYLYVESDNGAVPWVPNVVEMFAEDWIVNQGQ